LAEIEKAKKEADKEKKKAETYAQKAKEWADQRVATVGNQITVQKDKTKDLERDLEKEQEKSKNLSEAVAWYEKKFGIAPGNFNKLKK
jgi:chromosome segregation ATPase